MSPLKSGRHIDIAPEGTRSPTASSAPSRAAASAWPSRRASRILPVAIDGTRHVLPAHS